jgi:hypothetical protein
LGQLASSRIAPRQKVKDFLAPVLVGPDAEGTPEVIEDDRRVGKCARQARQLGDLRVVEPGVEAQTAAGELGKAAAKAAVTVEARRRIRV